MNLNSSQAGNNQGGEVLLYAAIDESDAAPTLDKLMEPLMIGRATVDAAMKEVTRYFAGKAPGDRRVASRMVDRHYAVVGTTGWAAQKALEATVSVNPEIREAAVSELSDPFIGYPPLLRRLNTDLVTSGETLLSLARETAIEKTRLRRFLRGDTRNVSSQEALALTSTLADFQGVGGDDLLDHFAGYNKLFAEFPFQGWNSPIALELEAEKRWPARKPISTHAEWSSVVGTVGATVAKGIGELLVGRMSLDAGKQALLDKAVAEYYTSAEEYGDLTYLAMDILQEDEDITAIEKAIDPRYGLDEFLKDLRQEVYGANLSLQVLADTLGVDIAVVSKAFRDLYPISQQFVLSVAGTIAEEKDMPRDQRRAYINGKMKGYERYMHDRQSPSTRGRAITSLNSSRRVIRHDEPPRTIPGTNPFPRAARELAFAAATTPEELEGHELLVEATIAEALDTLHQYAETLLSYEKRAAERMLNDHRKTLALAARFSHISLRINAGEGRAIEEMLHPFFDLPPIVAMLKREALRLNVTPAAIAAAAGPSLSTDKVLKAFVETSAHFMTRETAIAIAETLARLQNKDSTDFVDEARRLYADYEAGLLNPSEDEARILPEAAKNFDDLLVAVGVVGATMGLGLGKLQSASRRVSGIDRKGAELAISKHRRHRDAYYELAFLSMGIRAHDPNALRRGVDPKYDVPEFLRDLTERTQEVGLGLADIAAVAGLTVGTVSKILNGKASASPQFTTLTIQLIASQLPPQKRRSFTTAYSKKYETFIAASERGKT